MTFKVPLFRRSTTVSDQGFRVTFISWGILRYESGDLSLDLLIEAGGRGVVIERSSLRGLNGALSQTLDEDQEKCILNNITEALEWRGWTVKVVP
jgi:hypothetical protein